jgi:hypothetical protein
MERKKATDFDPEVLILFDAYTHGAIDRAPRRVTRS